MPQPYKIKTSSSQPTLSKTKTLMDQMYPKGKKAIPKGGVQKYNDAQQGKKRPLF